MDIHRQELLKKQEELYAPITELNDFYRKSLETLKERHQQSGNLDGVLTVEAVIKAIDTGAEVDPGNDADLGKLQKTYAEAKNKRAGGLEEKFSALLVAYLEKLEKLQIDLTQEGNVDDAVAVRSEFDFVSKMLESGTPIPVGKWVAEERRLSLIPEDAVEFEGHKYKVIDETLSWPEAKAKCEGLGGHLVCIGSKDEDRFVASLREGRHFLWIGLVSNQAGEEWKWINGSEYDYSNWRDNRPDNSGGVNAGVMNRWDQWDDALLVSDNIPAFVCEWP